MQTSLARRQRHRRTGAARRPRGGGAARRVAIAIPLALFLTLLCLGLVAFVGAVAAYSYYSRDLESPRALLSNLQFEEQTIVYDRTGKIELARLGDLRRELVDYDEIPASLIDATTSIEDKDFWKNPGFDFGGFVSASLDTLNGRPRGGSTITQQLVRQRLLPASAFEGEVWERKAREIIQSIRLTDEYPGEEGKREIMTAYLNQNYYGNHSYGVKAAAKSYFNKSLADLTLAEVAILAAIPQSPAKFDLTVNAEERCVIEIEEGAECPADQLKLLVPKKTEIMVRRNYVLDQMQKYAVLTKGDFSAADFRAARAADIILADQRTTPWRAPHFVWQVREQLASILCPGKTVDECPEVDAGGYRVTTSLDYKMQTTTQKWVYAAARAPHYKNRDGESDPRALLRQQKIPESAWDWILDLRGANIHNGAAAIVDYRTGEVLAYVGSAGYSATGNKKFDPKFDVLSQGWRQPGSAIKPLNYLVGLQDRSMTAATMFMDVTTDFGNKFTPTQADGYERGPVRLRSALQFSLNIPSIKAGLINGLEHFYDRTKEMGLTYHPGAMPVTSMGIGTLEVHPIDLLRAYGAIANGGNLMPQTMIREIVDTNGKTVWSMDGAKGTQIASPEASFIITDILAGNTDVTVNPYWGKWAIYDGGERRSTAYKTGTTSDNRDVAAYGYLAPPADPNAPAIGVGVWMGNSNNEPNTKLSLDTAAPLWSAILTEVSQGMPQAKFNDTRPAGLSYVEIDAHSGMLPGPFTTRTLEELFIKGTEPRNQDDLRAAVAIDAATGLLWQDDCTGPRVVRGMLDFSGIEPAFPEWQKYTRNWISRARRGILVRGGPEATRTMYFYDRLFHPFGTNWGGQFAPSGVCEPLPPDPCDPFFVPPSLPPGSFPPPTPEPCITPPPEQPTPSGGGGGGGGGPPKTPKPPGPG